MQLKFRKQSRDSSKFQPQVKLTIRIRRLRVMAIRFHPAATGQAGKWLRRLYNRCIIQTVHKLTCPAIASGRRRKGQPRTFSGSIGGLLAMLFIGVVPARGCVIVNLSSPRPLPLGSQLAASTSHPRTLRLFSTVQCWGAETPTPVPSSCQRLRRSLVTPQRFDIFQFRL